MFKTQRLAELLREIRDLFADEDCDTHPGVDLEEILSDFATLMRVMHEEDLQRKHEHLKHCARVKFIAPDEDRWNATLRLTVRLGDDKLEDLFFPFSVQESGMAVAVWSGVVGDEL